MSRGPGRIERAIRDLFDANPDEAFTTDDLCIACYPRLKLKQQIERKHRVAVARAASKVIIADRNWRSRYSWCHGSMLLFYSMASLRSVALADVLLTRAHYETSEREKWLSDLINPSERNHYGQRAKDRIERTVRDHIELRDADPAALEQITVRQKDEADARLARCRAALGIKPQMLSEAQVGPRATLTTNEHEVLSEGHDCRSDNTYLADRLCAVLQLNDPDQQRAEITAIAAQLDAAR